MAAVKIPRKDMGQRIVARIVFEVWFDTSREARPKAVAAVENRALVNNDRLQQAVGFDIFDERRKGLALEERENIGKRMEGNRGWRGHARTPAVLSARARFDSPKKVDRSGVTL